MSDFDMADLMNAHIDAPLSPKEDNVIINPNENSYLARPEQGLKLCAQLIMNCDKNNPINVSLDAIKQIIEQEFLPHTEADDNTVGAATYSQLHHLVKQLDEAASFPHLEKCYTVAVGGAFSAGKSRFLNSVLGCDSLLPVDITPTTAIPTYISHGIANSIQALNFYQKKTEIDEDALKAICHAFNKRFGVTFSHLLQLISVEREEFNYQNLIFLDTPGYSKSDDISNSDNNTDENIAREHLRRADYLIWLVDEQNGTIPHSDLEFIQSLNMEQPILVVISKADKKTSKEINEIIDVTKSSLQRAEINYLDVIGFSAAKNKEFSPSGTVLELLLDQVNKGKNGSTLLWQLKRIFKNYIDFYESKQQTLKLTNTTLNELVFDEGVTDKNRSHLKDLQKKTKVQLQEFSKQKVGAGKIRDKLIASISQLCEQLGIKNSEHPNLVALQALHKKNRISEKTKQAYTFDGLVQGDIQQLADLASLAKIKGEISKISAQGLSVKVNADLQLYIMQLSIKTQLGAIKLTDEFYVTQPVSVHIIDSKKCTVTIELDK